MCFPEWWSALLACLLTYLLRRAESFLETNRFSASQEIPCILWNPNVQYRNHKCPPPVPFSSHIDPVHVLTPHFLKIHINIILPSTPGSSKWSHSLRFPHQTLLYTSPLTIRATYPAHLILLGFITSTILGEQCRSLLTYLLHAAESFLRS